LDLPAIGRATGGQLAIVGASAVTSFSEFFSRPRRPSHRILIYDKSDQARVMLNAGNFLLGTHG
jgi:hypothetical protein